MTILASTLINWSALQKIFVVALIGGAGVVLAFGVLLIGLKWARGAKTGPAKLGGATLVGLGTLFCIATVVIGIIAMADKPTAKKPAKKSAAVLIHRPPGSGRAASSTD
jgi:hypothetical protein